MAKLSKYQQQAIRNYYQNREAIALQRLGELVSELYLAEGKKRKRLWQTVAGHMEKLDLPKGRIEHLIGQDNPALVAELVKQLLAK